MVDVKLMALPHGEGLPTPTYESELAAGMDLPAAVAADEPILIAPGARELVPTGFAMAIPPGYEGQLRPRSGNAFRHGITVLNSPGTIDADYRGEIKILLVNLGDDTYIVERGQRIAQLIIAPVLQARLQLCDLLEETPRGEGGFGSTG